jgi:hypothetical protein
LIRLSEPEWKKLLTLASILKTPYEVTIKLQSASITPGSFLKEWSALKAALRKQPPLASPIADSMEQREGKLFDNDLFLAAVFVDARYRILLNEEQVERAKHGLRAVVKRIRFRTCQRLEVPSIEAGLDSSTSTDDEFEKELDCIERRRRFSAAAPPTDIDEDIEAMLTLGRIKASPFVAAERYPSGLKAATRTLTAMPVSQVSVERLFSGLKFILSDQRGALKADLVEAILFLRTNSSR